MAKSPTGNRPQARVPRGFRDIDQAELRAQTRMLNVIREVYETYGFEALETPAIEYTDALGKFLPDQDRPNEGVFSFQDVAPEERNAGAEQWLSLRYDLTAPLARYVAENFDRLPKPFRRYATGPVWRNEKPGPGRFRQFTQFDADTVGTESVAADAEICMLAADTLERLGLKGKYKVKVSNRKILDGLMEAIGLSGDENASKRLIVLRAIDKWDRLGWKGVKLLLGEGRTDESGDRTPGANLTEEQINPIGFLFGIGPSGTQQPTVKDGVPVLEFEFDANEVVVDRGAPNNFSTIEFIKANLPFNPTFLSGIDELNQIASLVAAGGYDDGRIVIDPSVVRGLEYYTGPVFEAELTFEVKNEDGETVRFGSVGGGGRYDDLVARFTGQRVPATGFSIGVSRLAAALRTLQRDTETAGTGPVVVLVMDKAELPRYQKFAKQLRDAGIRAEMYLGTSGMKAQMKYADKRGAPCAIIQGSQERDKGEVQIKDLIEGAKAAAAIKDNKEWKEARVSQVSVPEADLVKAVREVLARHT